MNKKIPFVVGFCLSLLVTSLTQAEEAPAVVEIPLPNSELLKFRAVYLGIDGKVSIGTKKVTLGSRTASNFRERLTDVPLSGSFISHHKGRDREEWCYYLGQTEVTESQWSVFMGGEGAGSALPKTSVSVAEVALFLEKLNAHLLGVERERLPTLKEQLAFCRLPTEVEWEFAARGGSEVSGEQFDRPHPYGNSLARYEWFLRNSRGELREVGGRDPSPTGLCDMLGNAAELTGSLYSLDYGSGRVGGWVVRGCRVNVNEGEISASRREEYFPYIDQNPSSRSSDLSLGAPRRDRRIGFRLALATPVFGPQFKRGLAVEWEEYEQNRPVGADILRNQVELREGFRIEKEILNTRLSSLEAELKAANANVAETNGLKTKEDSARKRTIVELNKNLEIAERRVELLVIEKTKLIQEKRDLVFENLETERKKVYALIRIAGSQGYLAYKNRISAEILRKNSKSEKANEREKVVQGNLEIYRRDYIDLADSSPTLIEEEFRQWRSELEALANTTQQQNVINALDKHLKIWRTKRITKTNEELLSDIFEEIER